MEYISVKEASEKWGVTRRHVQVLYAKWKVDGAIQISGVWVIPAEAEKLLDSRRKTRLLNNNP